MRVKTAIMFASLMLSTAACGGGDEGVASVDGADESASPESSAAGPEDAFEMALDHAECMREHGIEDFPDPTADGGFQLDPETLGVDPVGPEMRAAEEACEGALPGSSSVVGGEG